MIPAQERKGRKANEPSFATKFPNQIAQKNQQFSHRTPSKDTHLVCREFRSIDSMVSPVSLVESSIWTVSKVGSRRSGWARAGALVRGGKSKNTGARKVAGAKGQARQQRAKQDDLVSNSMGIASQILIADDSSLGFARFKCRALGKRRFRSDGLRKRTDLRGI